MMLKKILKIKNLGLFREASCESHEFKKATLVYAENGRGKSTLANLLRSCATNDATSISLWKSLDGNDSPEIKLLFECETRPKQFVFNNNTWSDSYTDILVFDTEFVDKNVYSGTTVNPSHRQELLEFALGEAAVQLKQAVELKAQEASEKAREIKEHEKSLSSYTNGMPIATFSNLTTVPDVDEKINSLNVKLSAAKDNEILQKKACPKILNNLQLDVDKIFEILATTLDDIEKDAEETVRLHISNHSNQNFENWLSQGQLFENKESCPYCSQDITENVLIKAYKTHFNQAYKNLQVTIQNLLQDIETKLSDTIVNDLFSALEKNQLIVDQWSDHVSSQQFELDKDKLSAIFKQIRNLLYDLAQAKRNNPLEKIGSDTEKDTIKELWIQAILIVDTCNNLINISILDIADFKSKLSNINIQQIETEIKNLELVKVRHTQNVCDLIQQWRDAKQAKNLAEKEKTNARNQLDELMTQTLAQYQTTINELVRNFGVRFEIVELKHDYRGSGTPRSSYGLKVKGQDVSLSTETAPSFSTALSEGDKRTLAFAFFIARIKVDANISQKIIVVDDPVCSLDRNRRNCTKRILRDICISSSQLIVLGHDQYFLRDLRDDLQQGTGNISLQLLKIVRAANDCSNFSSFDIDNECSTGYYKNHKIIQDFISNGASDDLLTVARSIRPLLEGYLHRRFPGHIQRTKLFGQIIGEAKAAQLPNPLAHLQPLATELYQINDYAGQFHHDADPVVIDESELLSYARRALNIIHKGAL
jgi:wobble nucleotide-excising tRNase